MFNADDEEVVVRFKLRTEVQVEFRFGVILWEKAFEIVVKPDLGHAPTHP